MPLLFWIGAPALMLLWAQVVWRAVWFGSRRAAPWWIGPASTADRRDVIVRAGFAGFVSMGMATSHSMPWHAGPGQVLEQGSWTWAVATAVATAVAAAGAWQVTGLRGRAR